MNFRQVNLTGSRLVAPLSELGHVGPKHHAIVIGQSESDGKIYLAESKASGYQLCSLEEFQARFAKNGKIRVVRNSGKYSDSEVGNRALDEVRGGGKGKYNFITNNCESFSNRAMLGTSVSSQVINTCISFVALVGTYLVIKGRKGRKI